MGGRDARPAAARGVDSGRLRPRRELPATLAAMGFDAVGFARVPGVDTSGTFRGAVAPRPGSLAEELLASSLDFVWEAADGARVLAHWMPQTYCQGDTIDQPIG